MNWKNIINKIKNSLNGLNSRNGIIEKIISEFKDRTLEIIQSEYQKEKKMNRVSETFGTIAECLLLSQKGK